MSDAGEGKPLSLAELVESIKQSSDPALELVERTIEQARTTDPELADALRFCAIPKWFDAKTIGVLRGRPEASEENQRLLEGVTRYSFVVARAQGGYMYHDSTRDPLLRDWRTHPARREEFETLAGRLVAYHERLFDNARGLQDLLRRHASILRRANQARFLLIAAEVQRRLLQPLQEALHYERQISGPAVREFINRNSDAIEADGRLAKVVADRLHAYLEGETGGSDEPWYRWLRYWEARLLRGRGRGGAAEAEKLLRGLLEDAKGDTKLLTWVLSDLGNALLQLDRFAEAQTMLERELEVAERTGVDRWNLPSSYSRVGTLDYSLDRLDQAEARYRRAKELADSIGNVDMQIYTRLNLGDVLRDLGDLEGALVLAFEALDIARARPSGIDQLPAHATIAETFLRLFVTQDRWLMDTTHHEALELSTLPPGSTPELVMHSRYVDLLRDSGQLQRAEAELRELEQHPAVGADPGARVEVLFRRAMLEEDLGDLEQAVDTYTRLIDEARVAGFESSYNSVAATSNRGMQLVQVGRWEEAGDDLEVAAQGWAAMGHDRLVALIRIHQADSAGRQGRFEDGRQLLAAAREVLQSGTSAHTSALYHISGHLDEREGHLEAAQANYRRALELDHTHHRAREAGKELVHLITVAARRGSWEEAAELADEASRLWRGIDETARQPPDPRRQAADRFNARGLRMLLTATDSRRERLTVARELFEQAIEQVDDNPWYRLNLSYASAALESWGQAAAELEDTLRQCPPWLPTTWLRKRLADCKLRHARSLARGGRHKAALDVLRDTFGRFPDVLPPDEVSGLHLDAGENLLHLGDLDGAHAELTAGLAEASSRPDPSDQAAFRVRLALVAAVRADFPTALEELRQGLDLDRADSSEEAAARLVRRLSETIRTRGEYRAGREALRLLSEDPALDPRMRSRLAIEGLDLSRHALEDQHRGPRPSEPSTDAVTEQRLTIPIILDADNELYPQGRDTPAVEWMLETGIPRLQEQVWRDTGVRIPGVTISASADLVDGAYAIRFHEQRLASGVVRGDERFCPDLAGCRTLGVDGTVGPDPGGRGEGLWLAESHWEVVERAGLGLIDPYAYMLAHLQRLLLDRNEAFLNLQGVRWLLDDWAWGDEASYEERAKLRDRAVPDEDALVRLTVVLRLLREERVPIRNLGAILGAFADADGPLAEPEEVLASVRLALRRELPGVESAKLVVLSAGLEEAIQAHLVERDGRRFLAVPLNEVEALEERLLGELEVGGAPLAVVTRSPVLRPSLWRLLRRHRPETPVLAEPELAGSEAGETGSQR
jgi:tetratricopeptide (TPR) repeat protein